jgi:hypothetical protein
VQKLRTQGTGLLRMVTAGILVTVADSAVFAGPSSNTHLTNGTLRLRGHLVQAGGSAAAFSASGAHVTELAGTALQTVSFASPGNLGTNSHFAGLRIGNASPSGVQFQSPVFAVGNLTTVPGRSAVSLVGSSAGDSLSIEGATADSLTFDQVPVRIGSSGVLGALSVIRFQNMDPARDHLRITRSAGSYSINLLDFASAPNAGVFNLVVNNTAAAAGLTLTVTNGTPSDAVMIGPPARYQKLGNAPVIVWNTVQLP